MRLPNSYGSVFKLAGKRRRPYAVLITTGWTDEGKAIRKYHSYHATKTDALKALADYNANPYSLESHNITLAELWDKWQSYRAARDKTVPRYYTAAYKHAAPLHDMPFRDIQTSHIQNIVDGLTTKPASANNIKKTFGLLYKYAKLLNLVSDNRAALVELPTTLNSRKHKPFTADEMAELWQHQDEPAARLALILCYTGLRPSELLTIKTANVHLAERYMIGGMKTKAGIDRHIPLAQKIMPLVQQLYCAGNEYLVVEDSGKPMSYAKLYSTLWQKSTIPALQNHLPHDGRHTCETALDNAGTNKRITQLIIGHAGKDVDEAVYTHKTLPQLITAIDNLVFV